MQVSDIDDIIYWNTEEIEWQNWDAPWLHKEEDDFDWETYRKEKTVMILNPKGDDVVRQRFEVCINDEKQTHIGSISSYFINDQYKIDENSTNNITIGMDIYEVKYRRHGYGRQAYMLYLQYLKQHGYTHVYTQTWSGNVPLIKMAQSLGFKECNRFVGIREVNQQKYDELTFVLYV